MQTAESCHLHEHGRALLHCFSQHPTSISASPPQIKSNKIARVSGAVFFFMRCAEIQGGKKTPAHIDVGDRRRSREEEEQGLPEKRAVRCRTPGCVRKPGRSWLCQLAHIGMRAFFISSLERQTFGGPLVCDGSPPFSPPLFLCISLLSDDA